MIDIIQSGSRDTESYQNFDLNLHKIQSNKALFKDLSPLTRIKSRTMSDPIRLEWEEEKWKEEKTKKLSKKSIYNHMK